MKIFVKVPLIIILTAIAMFAQSKTPSLPKTVSKVDLNRYAGEWFEIARNPNKFQKKCKGNTTATYQIRPDRRLNVINRCLTSDGSEITANGEAKIVDSETNAKLKVRFAPDFLSFLPFVWADYWIISLDSEYRYAIVGTPRRDYLWILSRTPQIEEAKYQELLHIVENQGFDPKRLEKTPQNVKVLKGSVITE